MTRRLTAVHPPLASTRMGRPFGAEPEAAARAAARAAALAGEQQATAQRLRLLREAGIRTALAHQDEIAVAAYVLTAPDQPPGPRLAEGFATAERHRWPVAFSAVEVTGDMAPQTRPQLARIHAALARGQIRGVVAASRVDISTVDGFYEEQLYRIHAAGGFLSLTRNEVVL